MEIIIRTIIGLQGTARKLLICYVSTIVLYLLKIDMKSFFAVVPNVIFSISLLCRRTAVFQKRKFYQ